MPAVAAALYQTLLPLTTEDRRRVVHAALALLGDLTTQVGNAPSSPATTHGGGPEIDAAGAAGLPADAQKWLKKNGLTRDRLDEFFQFDGEAAQPFTLPESVAESKRERTKAAYLLQGVFALLTTGRPAFADDAARQFCVRLGCYDQTNHSKYVSGLGSQLTGSKDKGYLLTVPGLAAAAALLKTS